MIKGQKMKRLINAKVITRSEKLGLGTNIWYSIDYEKQGIIKHTIQYGKHIEEACQKIGIDWLK